VSVISNLKEKKKKRKTIFKTKKKRKEILNNDLAILPSHDIQSPLPPNIISLCSP